MCGSAWGGAWPIATDSQTLLEYELASQGPILDFDLFVSKICGLNQQKNGWGMNSWEVLAASLVMYYCITNHPET